MRAARWASRFSLICSILKISFSSAILLKLLFSSMALSRTSRSCSRFSARAFSTWASWDWWSRDTLLSQCSSRLWGMQPWFSARALSFRSPTPLSFPVCQHMALCWGPSPCPLLLHVGDQNTWPSLLFQDTLAAPKCLVWCSCGEEAAQSSYEKLCRDWWQHHRLLLFVSCIASRTSIEGPHPLQPQTVTLLSSIHSKVSATTSFSQLDYYYGQFSHLIRFSLFFLTVFSKFIFVCIFYLSINFTYYFSRKLISLPASTAECCTVVHLLAKLWFIWFLWQLVRCLCHILASVMVCVFNKHGTPIRKHLANLFISNSWKSDG